MQWRVQWRNAKPHRRIAPANNIGTTPARALLLLASYLKTDQLRPSQRAKNTPHARTPVALCPFCSVSRSASRFSESLARTGDAMICRIEMRCMLGRACVRAPRGLITIAKGSEARRNWVGTIT